MYKLIRTLLPVLAAMIATTVSAQSVSWKSSVQHLDGQTYRIVLEASIPAPWHMYDMGPYEGGPNATTITFTPGEGAVLEGGVEQLTRPERHYDKTFGMEIGTFARKAQFAQSVKLTAPQATVKAELAWMICNDTSCLPPDDTELTITLPAGATPAVQPAETPAKESAAAPETVPAAEIAPAQKDAAGGGSLWGLIIEAILWGFAALLTPCVFPMVPMTVSFFMKGSGSPALGRIRALSAQINGAATLDDVRPLLSELQAQMTSRRGVKVVPMLELLQDFSARHASGAAADYVGFGLDVLDHNSFIRRGDVVVLGGYPSDGKTALALMMAYHMAKTLKVGFFSLETSAGKIGDRIVTQGMQIDFDAIKRSRLTDRDWGTFAVCSEDAVKRRLDVIQASGMTAGDIMAESITYGYDVIFVDYVQLIVPEGNPRDLRSEQMATVSRALHTFAQSRGVLVVELAQLSRPERGAWRAPDMHDLKETGQFEQDADLIVMIYRPDPKQNYSQEKCRVIQIAKSKEGRRGKGVFAFDGRHQTFAPYTRDDEKGRKEKTDGEAPGQMALEEVPEDENAPF